MFCQICMNNKREDEIIKCKNNHIICIECFNPFIMNEISKDIGLRVAKIMCPYHKCDSNIKEFDIAKNLNEDEYNKYMTALEESIKHQEKLLLIEESQKKEQFNTLIKKKDKIRLDIENILNPSCPYCKKVFFDNTGCRAVTCNSCNTVFCAYCCEFYGEKSIVHKHVTTCEANSSNTFFSSEKSFLEDRKKYFRQKLIKYLKELKEKEKDNESLEIALQLETVIFQNIIDEDFISDSVDTHVSNKKNCQDYQDCQDTPYNIIPGRNRIIGRAIPDRVIPNKINWQDWQDCQDTPYNIYNLC